MWHCCNALLRWRQALGSKTLKSKIACCPVSQTPCALMSSLASFVVFAVLKPNSSPVNGVNFGSISTSLQISDNIFASLSYRSLCLKDTKPPFLQLIQCWTLNLLPQEHVVGKFAILHPYRKRIASQKCCFDSLKPKSLISSAVSQYYPPIRLRNCDFSRKSWVTVFDFYIHGS